MSAQKTRDLMLLGLIATGRYLIDSRGQIFDRMRNEFRAPTVDADGHAVVHLWDRERYPDVGPVRVARLVAIACIGIPKSSKKSIVFHLDDDKLNNAPGNLLWVSHADLSKRVHRQGKVPHPVGEKLPHSKLNPTLVAAIRAELANGTPIRKVAALFEVSRGAINGIKQGKSWRHVP